VKNADRIDIRVLANWPLTKAEDSINIMKTYHYVYWRQKAIHV